MQFNKKAYNFIKYGQKFECLVKGFTKDMQMINKHMKSISI